MKRRSEVDLQQSHLHSDDNSSADEDVLLTQPVARPLAGVIAFVDVRLGRNNAINSGQTIAQKLTELGATVSPRLTKDVTHIVFKDGKTNLDRIDQGSVFVVSPLWVESSKRCNEQVSEAKYPVVCRDACAAITDRGVHTGSPVVLGRIKRIKSMQPKPFAEEEVTRSVERKRKRMANNEGSVSKRLPVHLDPFAFQSSESEGSNINSCEPTNDDDDYVATPRVPYVPNVGKRPLQTKNGAVKKKRKIIQSRQQNAFLETNVKEKTTVGNKALRKKPLSVTSIECDEGPQLSKRRNLRDKENLPVNSTEDKTRAVEAAQVKPKTEGCSSYSKRRSNRNSFEKSPPGIVITSLDTGDRETLLAVVTSLGGFQVSKTVGESTTHVICGAPRRTVNVLAGTAKGCWLLSVDWVWRSLESGKWLPEGAFEMVSEFPAAQFFRLERQHAGLLYRPSLFHKCGSIFVSQNTKPTPHELEGLLTIAGAKVTGSKRKADVCIGSSEIPGIDTAIVSEQWIIDSISEHAMLPLKDYILNKDGSCVRASSPEL